MHYKTYAPLTARIRIAGEEPNTWLDTRASCPIIGERTGKILGCWERARKVRVRYGDGSTLAGGKYIMNTTFKVFSKGSHLSRFTFDAEVWDKGKRDIVLGCSWLKEHGFCIDKQASC